MPGAGAAPADDDRRGTPYPVGMRPATTLVIVLLLLVIAAAGTIWIIRL